MLWGGIDCGLKRRQRMMEWEESPLGKGKGCRTKNELERTYCEVDMVVGKNEPQTESRSENAAGHMEGKEEADASAMRTDGQKPFSRREIRNRALSFKAAGSGHLTQLVST